MTALTLLSVKGAVGAALTELAAATGAGALLGKHVKNLAAVIQERLIGSPEVAAVQAVAASLREDLQEAGQAHAAEAAAEAGAYVLPTSDPLVKALETLRREAEAHDD